MSEVTLLIDDKVFTGWKTVEVARSFESVAGGFSLSLTQVVPLAAQNRAIAPFVPCQLLLDGDPVVAGVLDQVSPKKDARSHSITAKGRSLPAQLVDCSCELMGGELRGLSIVAAARRLAQPFGVEVVDLTEAGSGTDRPFQRIRIEQGESVFEVLERLARQRAVFLTDDAQGRLVIRRRSTALQGTLEIGVNALSVSADFNGQEQFSNYTLKGQSEGDDATGVAVSTGASAKAIDGSVPIHRPLIVLSEAGGGLSDLAERAQFEAALRRARGRRWTYQTAGWRTDAGTLWKIGEEVEVTDVDLALDHERLLAVEVQFTKDEGGELTNITLAPPEGYDLIAEKERVEKAAATGWDSL